MARLVLFNRRRGGETERVTLESYEKRLNKYDSIKEVEETLSPVEKMLCLTFVRIETLGNKGCKVPVLFTPAVLSSIDLLIHGRKKAGVNPDNVYVFPRPNNGSLLSLRTTDVLQKFAHAAELKSPQSLTST